MSKTNRNMYLQVLITRMPFKLAVIFCLLALYPLTAAAQNESTPVKGKTIYDQIRACSMAGGSADVSGLVLKRDRVTMTFTGTFYFAAPVEGKVNTAVFIGSGNLHADPPPSEFEKKIT